MKPPLDAKMAVNRIKAAMAVPRKGETFELRSGLVYGYKRNIVVSMLTAGDQVHNMHMKERRRYKRQYNR